MVDEVTFAPCVRSGFCCSRAPCPFGRERDDGPGCRYLLGPGPGRYWCPLKDWIETRPFAHFSPAFGAGCSSTLFNPDRRRILQGVDSAP